MKTPRKSPIKSPYSPFINDSHLKSKKEISPSVSRIENVEDNTITSFLNYLYMIYEYIVTSIHKRPKSFKIGVFSIFMVLGFVITLQSSLNLTNVIFVKLAENTSGDTDLIITKTSDLLNNDNITYSDSLKFEANFINGTVLENVCRKIKDVIGCTPRWLFKGLVYGINKQKNHIHSYILMLNSQKEKSIGLGRNFNNNKKKLKKNQCFITHSMIQALGLDHNREEMKVQVQLDIKSYQGKHMKNIKKRIISKLITMNQNKKKKINLNNEISLDEKLLEKELKKLINKMLRTKITLKVIDTINESNGKYPSLIGNILLLDYRYFNDYLYYALIKALNKKTSQSLNLVKGYMLKMLQNFDLRQFAMSENLIIENKINFYQSIDKIDNNLVFLSNNIVKKSNKSESFTFTSPLTKTMTKLFYLTGFLDNLFLTTLGLLCILSILLIYSLAVLDLQEKMRDFGILRALGLSKEKLLGLLMIQGLSFSVPGMMLGILFSLLGVVIGKFFVYDFCLIGSEYNLSNWAIFLSILIGFIMPIISNIMPISRVLSKTLSDSLESTHRIVDNFTLNVMKLEEMGVSISQTINALTLVTMGFIGFYLAPRALINKNIPNFMTILNLILMFLLAGLTILTSVLQQYLEKMLLKFILLFCYKDRKLEPIINKNMDSHRSRNSKTAMLFGLSVSFMMFAGGGLLLFQDIVIKTIKSNIGGDMTAEIQPSENFGLKEGELIDFLNQYHMKYPDNIHSFSFVSFPLSKIVPNTSIEIMPLTKFPKMALEIHGIEEKFLFSSFKEFFAPTDSLEDYSNKNFFSNQQKKSFYLDSKMIISNSAQKSKFSSNAPIIELIIPEAYHNFLSLSIGTNLFISVNEHYKYLAKMICATSKMPGFSNSFSSYKILITGPIILTSMKMLKFLVDDSLKRQNISKDYLNKFPSNLTYGLPKDKLYIKFAKELNKTERTILANGLRTKFTDQNTFIYDTHYLIEATLTAVLALRIYLYVISAIAQILSFFLVLVSFISNIQENSLELGILRSLGLSKAQINRVFIYQALCLLIGAGILGSIVGLIVCNSLAMQFIRVIQIPYEFHFPYIAFGFVIGSGILTSILASVNAVKEVTNKQIAYLVKGELR